MPRRTRPMARAWWRWRRPATSRPGTAGSQFFVVTGAGTGLTPDYALLGKVTKGMDVVQAIGKLGDPASGGAGTPLQSVVIEKDDRP